MTKVFMVTCGEYSDYSVCEAFSSEKLAKDYCRLHNSKKEDGTDVQYPDGTYWYTPDYCIEEYTVDPEVPTIPKDKFGFSVHISKDGEAALARHMPLIGALSPDVVVYFFGPPTANKRGFKHTRDHVWEKSPEEAKIIARLNSTEFMVMNDIVARDKKHAIKIANERRAQCIALNRWPPEYDNCGSAKYKRVMSDTNDE